VRRAAAVEQGQPFVTCRFCGATNFVDKARAVFHYLVRPTVREDGARAALEPLDGGQRYGQDLDRKAKVDSVSFEYFPMWLVRAIVQHDERVLLKPAAALAVSELEHLNIPPSDLVRLIPASTARLFRPASRLRRCSSG